MEGCTFHDAVDADGASEVGRQVEGYRGLHVSELSCSLLGRRIAEPWRPASGVLAVNTLLLALDSAMQPIKAGLLLGHAESQANQRRSISSSSTPQR